MIKKGIIVILLILLLGFIYSLGKQVYESLQVNKRLDLEAEELLGLQRKNSDLKRKLAEVQTPQFIESQARDKLNLVRPGETTVIIPRQEIDKILGAEVQKVVNMVPNWQGWLKLFWK